MNAADQNIALTGLPSGEGLLPPNKSRNGGLPGMGDMLSRTWEIYKRRMLSFLAVILIGAVLTCLPAVVLGGLGYVVSRYVPEYKNMLGVIMGLFALLGAIWCFMWAMSAFFVIVADLKIEIKEAFKRARPKIHSMFWLSALTTFLITGGYCLFIIPGLVFQVWFFFAPFVLILEDTRGMNALMKSREYVRGRWFKTAWRLLAVWLTASVIAVIPIIGPIAAFLVMPFCFVHTFVLYNDLKTTRELISFQPTLMAKIWVFVAGFLGFLVIPAILFAFMGSMILFPLLVLKHKLTGGDMLSISSGTEAVEGLSLSGGGGQPSIEENIRILQDRTKSWMDREKAVSRLARSKDPKAVNPLIHALESDKNVFVRAAAAESLGKLGDRQAVESLRKALNDEELVQTGKSGGSWVNEKLVAKNAALALAKLGVPATPADELEDTGDFAEFLEAFHSTRYQEAIKLGKRVLAAEPDHVKTLTKMGISFYELGRRKTARKYFKRVLELDPANKEAGQYLED